jgi:hypothetical protein
MGKSLSQASDPARAEAEERPGATSPGWVDLDHLPLFLALPLKDYCQDDDPILKLWRACHTVEVLLRLLVVLGLAELRRDGPLAPLLVRQLEEHIDEPTLGRWKAMAVLLAREVAKHPAVLPRFAGFVLDDLTPGLDGLVPPVGPTGPAPGRESPEASFIALRNQLAHGGGLPRSAAARLLNCWQGWFEALWSKAPWLADLAVVVSDEAGRLHALRGPGPEPVPFAPVEDPDIRARWQTVASWPGRIALVYGPAVLPLWPLVIYGPPLLPSAEAPGHGRRLESPVAQLYVRKGQATLHFLPFGASDLCQSEGDEAAWAEFHRLFHTAQARGLAGPGAAGFEEEIARDARNVSGRESDVAVVHAALGAGGGVHWLAGVAGVGKSYLMARVAADLLQAPPPDTLIVPYRFKAGDERCSRERFLALAVERLRHWPGVAATPAAGADPARLGKWAAALEALLQRLRPGRRVLFLLDGLDEVIEKDTGFAAEVPLGATFALPGVTWLCAGRSERRLTDVFTLERCHHVFPDGLRRLTEGEVRTLLLNRLEAAQVRERLLMLDNHKADQELFEVDDAVQAELDNGHVSEPLRRRFHAVGVALSANIQVEPRGKGRKRSWLVRDSDTGTVVAIRPRGGRLVALGERVVNPFIHRVVASADGLPLYVNYVINDLLSGRRRLDAEEALPTSLEHYHEELLRRCQVNTLASVLPVVLAALAVAQEPLGLNQLAQLLGEYCPYLHAGDPETRLALVRSAIATLQPVIRTSPTAEGEVGYATYHRSLREQVAKSPTTRAVVEAVRRLLYACCADLPEGPLRPYVIRHGVSELLAAGRIVQAVELLHRLQGLPNLEPHLDRAYLHQFSRLVSLHLTPRACPADEAARIPPLRLAEILKGFYEIEPLYWGIRLLVDYHEVDWEAVRDCLLAADDFVITYTTARALADAYRDSGRPERLATILNLTERADANEQMLGNFALKFVLARRPELVDQPGHRQWLRQLAASDVLSDRMIVGEVLFCLAYRAVGERRTFDAQAIVDGEQFWQPVWPYDQLTVHHLNALQVWTAGRALANAPAGVVAAMTVLERTERWRTELLAEPWVQDTPELLRLFDAYYELGLHQEWVREAEPTLQRLAAAELERVAQALLAHPLWDVTEAGGSVLASIAEIEPAALEVIRRLIDSPDSWRVRYGAIEAAFGARFLDGAATFTEAVRHHARDANCRVRGLCAENLTAWVLNEGDQAKRDDLLDRFAAELGFWLRSEDDDVWTYERLHQLLGQLERRGHDVAPLLAGGVTTLLAGVPGWYRLGRRDFLRVIDARKRRLMGLG